MSGNGRPGAGPWGPAAAGLPLLACLRSRPLLSFQGVAEEGLVNWDDGCCGHAHHVAHDGEFHGEALLSAAGLDSGERERRYGPGSRTAPPGQYRHVVNGGRKVTHVLLGNRQDFQSTPGGAAPLPP